MKYYFNSTMVYTFFKLLISTDIIKNVALICEWPSPSKATFHVIYKIKFVSLFILEYNYIISLHPLFNFYIVYQAYKNLKRGMCISLLTSYFTLTQLLNQISSIPIFVAWNCENGENVMYNFIALLWHLYLY